KAKVIAEGGPEGKKATAETPITIKVTDPPKPLADIVFVLDVSPSMQWTLEDLKNGVGKLTDGMKKARIDFQLGLVTFQNLNGNTPKVDVIEFKGGPFTANGDEFRDEVGNVRVQIGSGGGVLAQSSHEGMAAACKLPFRKDATKVLLLVTGQT